MCSQYLVGNSWLEIFSHPDFLPPEDWPPRDGKELILPRGVAPVVYRRDGATAATVMQFGLIPSWSETRTVKFATHNARLDGLAGKPTWRKPLVSTRCLVPMQSFIEPIYDGEHAGYMVSFSPEDSGVLLAAGLYDSWADRESGEIVESFTIVTGEPSPRVRTVGHDRQPIFLPEEAGRAWIDPAERTAPPLIELLTAHQGRGEFTPSRFRPMRPGWERRKK